ncbi:protein ASPARTIC PROTEASE IN GUARD CELL 2-like [Rutidosis leptorrhynchoides]|uniref:protein ASPARTIC PROTEASE IN GUARD CELL 2-like n=1 Tax=Rutidosis leptorrhynchoides TaxID=125765 RepID=UPI003A995003
MMTAAILTAVVIMLILPPLATITSAATASSPSPSSLLHPSHQLLDVHEIMQSIKSASYVPQTKLFDHKMLESDEANDGKKWKLNLVHRDKLSEHHGGHRKRVESRLKRDVKRVAFLNSRIGGNHTTGGGGDGGRFEVEDFGSDVVSGMQQGSGEYFVRIGVGTPSRSQDMVVDSGSDVVWIQCLPCKQCYQQSDPIFDPTSSDSFVSVSCGSTICEHAETAGGCRGHGGGRWCQYKVSYGDGSFTKGTLALETLTFGNTIIRNVAIGCGHRNQGLFVGAAGLLGIGGGSISLVSQLGGEVGGAFSYCLVSRGNDSPGSLEFGRESLPSDNVVWVPLLRNPKAPSFYYVGLSGLGVGGVQVSIPEPIFKLSDMGHGGVVMDTGTAVTRLPTVAYTTFRDAFVAQTTSLPRAEPVSIFDTCYNLNGFVTVRVPTVSFIFSGGPALTLPANNFLIPVDDMGTFCFAFAPTSSGLSIIGNIQQEGIQISFDSANGVVGFGPNLC